MKTSVATVVSLILALMLLHSLQTEAAVLNYQAVERCMDNCLIRYTDCEMFSETLIESENPECGPNSVDPPEMCTEASMELNASCEDALTGCLMTKCKQF